MIAAIRAAEARTSGEIRVHVEHRATGDALSAARGWFHRLGMDQTKERNGILFYIAVDERAFAIIGDAEIHARVGDAFWQALRDQMHDAFAKGSPATGLSSAIEEAGLRLAEYFPRAKDDRNELTDEISYR